jgi:hypothetical protein
MMPRLLAALFLLAASAQAQRPTSPDSALYVVRIGNDTARFMWLIQDGRRLTTISANRIPTLRVLRGSTTLGNDWSVHALEQARGYLSFTSRRESPNPIRSAWRKDPRINVFCAVALATAGQVI